jgi:hypothetical protein
MTVDAELHVHGYLPLDMIGRGHGAVAGFTSNGSLSMSRMAKKNKIRRPVHPLLRHNRLILRHLREFSDRWFGGFDGAVANHAAACEGKTRTLGSLHRGVAIGALEF